MNNCFRLTVVFLALLFVSCSGVEQKEDNNLIGIWLCTESPAGYKDCYYTFLEDGKLVRDYDPSTSATAIYTFNADAKTLTSTLADSQETYQVVLLTSSNMQLVGGGFDAASWKFQKVQSVSFPALKVEDKDITIKVGDTKKLNVSGMGISFHPLGYEAKDGFIADTNGEHVLNCDNETLSITGKYIGKCKLVIDSKNGSEEITIAVEPNNPFWEHGFIIDKVKSLQIGDIVEELGIEYTLDEFYGNYIYTFDNPSEKINSLRVRYDNGATISFIIPLSQKDDLEKSLQEYGDSFLTSNYIPVYRTFLAGWTLEETISNGIITIDIKKGVYR